ncbi:MAG: KpsF/GutQ family sugar-phosphate isomerase [Myxococcota bacterium]
MRTYGQAIPNHDAVEPTVSVLDPMARDAREYFHKQAAAIAELARRLEDGAFGKAIQLLYGVEGHVIVTGIGKSGLVGQKISATLASTGTPSFFLHAAEAAHGDLGSVTDRDAVILISYSGETEEVVRLLPHLEARRVPTVALLGNPSSTLARQVDVYLDVSVDRELCPHNLAPTNSTLATLAMGDALAVALTRMRGFHPEDFARLHPGGSLGRRLLGRVADGMMPGPLPTVPRSATLADCILALARSRLPVVLVMDDRRMYGIVRDEALQAALEDGGRLEQAVEEVMHPEVPVIGEGVPLREAERLLREGELGELVVLDGQGRPVGLLTQTEV